MQPIASLRPGARAAVMGEIKSTQLAVTRRRGFKIFHAVVGDSSGAIRCSWMNQAYLADVIPPRAQVVIFGDVKLDSTGLHFLNPEFELSDRRPGHAERRPHRAVLRAHRVGDAEHAAATGAAGAGRPATPGAGSPARRPAHAPAARGPPAGARGRALPGRGRARRGLERFSLARAAPPHLRGVLPLPARPRVAPSRNRRRSQATPHHRGRPRAEVGGGGAALHPHARDSGPRSRRSWRTCRRPAPMHRLLQGDVGAGKTIVALLAAVVAMENGLQVALLAPTEILAKQHYATLAKLLAATRFRVDLLTGAVPGTEKFTIHANLGTGVHAPDRRHARARAGAGDVSSARPRGHRRAASIRRGAAGAPCGAKGLRPDVLLMTATPIPRTLALTDYSELDVSKIVGLPPGRQPIRTWVKPESRRDEIYQLIRARADRGPAGLRDLSTGRGVGEDRLEVGDRDGRPAAGGGVPGLPCRRGARAHEAGRQGPGHARLRDAARCTCWCRRRSSRWAWTCPTPR